MFKVIYIIFCISIILYRSEPIPLLGLTPRQLMTFIMLVACLMENKNYYKSVKIYNFNTLILFSVFLLNFAWSSLLSGFQNEFFHDLIGYYFVSLVAWEATSIMVWKEKGVKTLMKVFLIIGAFDAMVTILQLMGINYYEPIIKVLGINTGDAYDDLLHGEQMYGFSLPGIFENAVNNGYFLAINTVLSLYYYFTKNKIGYIALPLFFLIGVFCCQQRTAFYSSVAILIMLFFIHQKNSFSKNKLMGIILVVIVAYLALSLFSLSESYGMRYANNSFEENSRNEIFEYAQKYIVMNPIFANIFEFRKISPQSPHNLFLNAYIYGGLISFICSMIILFIQGKYIYYSMKMKLSNPSNINYLIIGGGLLVYTLNSLTHNSSFITGDMVCWMLWGALYTQYRITNFKSI